MAVRNKTRKRLWILLVGLLLLALLGSAGYVVRKRQIAARLVRDRDLGYAALKEEDYFTALHKIGPYVQKNGNDRVASLQYAIARLNVEEPNGKHITDAINMLRWLLVQEPENVEARKRLLDIYVSSGWLTEIMTATENRRDPASIRARAIALAGTGEGAKALDLSKQYNAMVPQDLEMQMFTCRQMYSLKTEPKVIEDYALGLQKSHPDDPRFELLLGDVYTLSGQSELARSWTVKAAKRSIDDPVIVRAVANQLDRLGELTESFALLQRASQVRGDLTFTRDVVSRLLQGGQYSAVLERTADVEQKGTKADADLLAYRAIALIESRRQNDANHVIDALRALKSNIGATNWADVLALANTDPIDTRQMILAARKAIRSRSSNPYFHLYYGDALARIGEGEIAVREWNMAREIAPTWPRPIARLFNVFLASRQKPDPSVFSRFTQLARDDADSLGAIAAGRLAVAGASPDAAATEEILGLVDRVQAIRSGDALTLVVKTRLLASIGRLEDARGVIISALDPSHTAPAATLIQLASVSELLHLDLEQKCFDRSRAAYGNQPELALAIVGRMLRTGRGADAVTSIETAMPAANARSAAWDIGYARVLEAVNDPRAAAQWSRVGNAQPDSAEAQYAVLASAIAQRDLGLQQHSIERLKAVTGDDGLALRMADARWNIATAPTRATPDEKKDSYNTAVKILGEITRAFPNHVEAHLLLSRVLVQVGDKDAATDHLATAIRLAPGALAPPLQLASLLEAMGDFERAKPYLNQAEQILSSQALAPTSMPAVAATTRPAGDPTSAEAEVANNNATREAWRTLARLRAAAGQTDQAIEILRNHGSDPSNMDLSYASLLSQSGKLTEEMRQQLLAQATPASIGIVAEYLLSTGQTAEAESTIAMLDRIEAPAADRELARAMYFGRKGDSKKAVEHLRAACAASPDTPRHWQLLVSSLLLSGTADDAIAACSDAIAKVGPEDRPRFERIVTNAKLVRGVITRDAARPLLALLVNDSDSSSEIINALTALQGELSGGLKPEQSLAAVRSAADQAQPVWPLQALVIDMYLRKGDSDMALGLAARSMRVRPNDPAPAQVATQIAVSRGRWEEVIGVARDWRQRAGARTLVPDQVLAQAYLATSNAGAAEKQLQPYLEQAKKDPANWISVLILYTQSIFSQGRFSDTESLIAPLLPVHEAFRAATRQLAVQPQLDRALARRWLERVEAATPADAVAERVALAAGWTQLSARDASLRPDVDRATQAAAKLVADSGSAKASDWTAIASVKETAGDVGGAEESYRAALKRDPNDPITQNNLAMIIIHRNGDVDEAIKLATAAASQESHKSWPDFLDTLALVQDHAKHYDLASDAINKAAGKRQDDPNIRADQVEILLHARNISAARQAMGKLLSIMSTIPKPDPKLLERVRELNAELQKVAGSN